MREHREAYLALLPRSARERLELVPAPGHEAQGDGIDLLFVDSSHDRDATVAELRAWQPRLAPGALVVLHDYGNPAYPGVAEAVAELGLKAASTPGCGCGRPPPVPAPFPAPAGYVAGYNRSQGVNHASQQAVAVDGDRVHRAVRVARRDERRGRVLRAQRGQGRRLRRRQGQLEHEARRRASSSPPTRAAPTRAGSRASTSPASPTRRRSGARSRSPTTRRARRRRSATAARSAAHRDLQRPVAARGQRGPDHRAELRQQLRRLHQRRQAASACATTRPCPRCRTGRSPN